MSKYTKYLKEITDIEEYLDDASEVLFNLSKEIRKSDEYDTSVREEDPQHWDYVLRGKGWDLYNNVKDELYDLALEKFPDSGIIDIVEPIEPY